MCTCVIILGTFICNPLRNNLGPVHTYLDSFQSTTFSFQIWLPSTRIRRIRQRIRIFLNPLSRVEENESAANPITCGWVNPDISDPMTYKFESNLLPNNKPIWGHNSNRANLPPLSSALWAHALNIFYCRGTLGTTMNTDTIGCVWTGEFDLNKLCVDGKIFEFGKKKLRIQKYPDQ